MSNYKYFIVLELLRSYFIAHCLFGKRMRAAALVLNEVCEFSGESQSKSSCTSDSNILTYFHGFLTFTDGEYTCEMQVMHLGKVHSASLSAAHVAFLSKHLTASRFKLKL